VILKDHEIDEAIGRLALTNDGRALYVKLQRILMETTGATEGGALNRFEGRRSLAHDLKTLMDRVLSESTSAGPDRHDPDRPVVVAPRQPVAVSGRAGTQRRVGPYAKDAGDAP
jgi:hypothetical protein